MKIKIKTKNFRGSTNNIRLAQIILQYLQDDDTQQFVESTMIPLDEFLQSSNTLVNKMLEQKEQQQEKKEEGAKIGIVTTEKYEEPKKWNLWTEKEDEFLIKNLHKPKEFLINSFLKNRHTKSAILTRRYAFLVGDNTKIGRNGWRRYKQLTKIYAS